MLKNVKENDILDYSIYVLTTYYVPGILVCIQIM
jgi:hypothetical protein